MTKRPLDKSPELIALFVRFCSIIEDFNKETLPHLDYESLQEQKTLELTQFVVRVVTRSVALFLKHQFAPDAASNPEALLSVLQRFSVAAHDLSQKLGDVRLNLDEHVPLDNLKECLAFLLRKGFNAKNGTRNLRPMRRALVHTKTVVGLNLPGAGLTKSRAKALPEAEVLPELPDADEMEEEKEAVEEQEAPRSMTWHPQNQLTAFIDAYASRANPRNGEFQGLVEIFLHHVGDEKTDEVTHVPPLQNLIQRMLHAGGEGMPIDQTATCARILAVILQDAAHTRSLLVSRQEMLLRFGAVPVVLKLISCETDVLYRAGLELGELLVRGGNRPVQEEMYRLLNSDLSEVAALDGSQSGFYTHVRDTLRLAVKEIPERISYAQVQREAEENFEEIAAGLAGATVELLRADMLKPFVTLAHPELLLSFLKELCEGMYNEIQDLFHDQPSLARLDIDLTLEICKLLLQLEASLDASNIRQIELCANLLVEVVQGNKSSHNVRTLLDTKLIAACNRLLTRAGPAVILNQSSSSSGAGGDAAAEQAISPEVFSRLHLRVLTLLHALLEANEGAAAAQLADTLDLATIATLAAGWHDLRVAEHSKKERGGGGSSLSGEGGSEAAVGGARRSSAAHLAHLDEAGFLAYRLLRNLTDRFPERAEATYAPMSEASRAHYEKFLGRVEIARSDGELECVYFRIPLHVFKLNAKTKEGLLWSVDRETPGVAVQEFLVATKDLHMEVVWQAILSRWRIFQRVCHHEASLELIGIYMAVVQNLLLVLDSSVMIFAGPSWGWVWVTSEDGSDEGSGRPLFWVRIYPIVQIVFGVVQMATMFLIMLVHLFRSTMLELLKRQTAEDSSLRETINDFSSPLANPTLFRRVLLDFLWVTVTDTKFVRKVVFLVCALLGLAVSERFFVVHLLQIVFFSNALLDVLRAVTENSRQLLLMLLLMAIVLWWYAVWMTETIELAGANETALSDNELATRAVCTTPGQCWLNILDLLGSGGADGLFPRPDYELSVPRYLNDFSYMLTYNVIVNIILVHASRRRIDPT